ncbi:hypothetical protein MO867_13595 [Microbulbifer sp. OS29]|uniref:Mu-like prophage FluMu N-terminal domain-containing protein n=1 Tax=Microbulbifer okhotskensis TaxID=2926617 RepID=A0A9X2J5A8_9GAMM|nr:hypothetical protein [Microbulbifer okhotskensis]MCO1335367.1 hypothetical protein [Microbulbifer okhotskensis]
MTKQIYKVRQPIKVAGKIIKAGTVSCTQQEAAPLLKNGSLIEAAASTNSSAGDGEISMEVFAEAVAQLDTENPEHWTNAGAPDIKALNKAGLKISAAERDALWAQVDKD